MPVVISYSVSGLNAKYILRHLVYGAVIGALAYWACLAMLPDAVSQEYRLALALVALGNTLCYPFSWYVVEDLIFYTFDNEWLGKIANLLKPFLWVFCWVFGMTIAPFGFAFFHYIENR